LRSRVNVIARRKSELSKGGAFRLTSRLRLTFAVIVLQTANLRPRAVHAFGRRSASRYPVRRCGPTRKEHAPWGGAHNAINVNATSVTADEVIE